MSAGPTRTSGTCVIATTLDEPCVRRAAIHRGDREGS